jgi:hypothetical protein
MRTSYPARKAISPLGYGGLARLLPAVRPTPGPDPVASVLFIPSLFLSLIAHLSLTDQLVVAGDTHSRQGARRRNTMRSTHGFFRASPVNSAKGFPIRTWISRS